MLTAQEYKEKFAASIAMMKEDEAKAVEDLSESFSADLLKFESSKKDKKITTKMLEVKWKDATFQYRQLSERVTNIRKYIDYYTKLVDIINAFENIAIINDFENKSTLYVKVIDDDYYGEDEHFSYQLEPSTFLSIEGSDLEYGLAVKLLCRSFLPALDGISKLNIHLDLSKYDLLIGAYKTQIDDNRRKYSLASVNKDPESMTLYKNREESLESDLNKFVEMIETGAMKTKCEEVTKDLLYIHHRTNMLNIVDYWW